MKNKELPTKLAQNLYKLRKSMGLTQKQVADAVGIKRSTYAYYERGTMPSIELIEKFAQIFNVSASYIVFPEDIDRSDRSSLSDGYEPGTMGFSTLSEIEQGLILKFRLLSPECKQELDTVIDEFLSRSE